MLVVHFPQTAASRFDRFHIGYHLANWSLPLIGATVSLKLSDFFGRASSYDDNNLYCWISSSYQDFRFFLFYIPLWVSMVATVSINLSIISRLKKTRKMLTSSGGGSASVPAPTAPQPVSQSIPFPASQTGPFDDASAAAVKDNNAAYSAPFAPSAQSFAATGYPPLKSPGPPSTASSRAPLAPSPHPWHVAPEPPMPPAAPAAASGPNTSGGSAGNGGVLTTAVNRGIRVFAFRTFFFLFAFFFKWLAPTINRIYVLGHSPSFSLFMLQAIFASTGGILNAVIYFGFDWLFDRYERISSYRIAVRV
ncbi:hypothetical protein HK405_014470 [Cladochytrium tenue]|nr:hypothetical protein HK405_014470 [Cladochytrium tenue]